MGEYDFKIEFMKNSYQLRLHPLDKVYFNKPDKDFKLKNYSITYHKKTENKPAKLHLKTKKIPVKYYDFPIKNIIDPKITPEFPIPLFKLGISKNINFRKFKKKKKNFVYDMGENNILEIYLVKKDFSYEKFISKWDVFDLIYTIVPMEYFVNGKLQNDFFKNRYNSIYEDRSLNKSIANVSEDLALQFNSYKNEKFYKSKGNPYISFYENGEYIKYLVSVPINYYYSDGKKTITKLAYQWQLERNKEKMSKKDVKYWKNYFNSWHNKLDRQKVVIDGFSLEGLE